MNKTDIYETDDCIIVCANSSDMQIKEIVIRQPRIKYHTNWITQFRGKKITEIEETILTKTYEAIETKVDMTFDEQQEDLKANLLNKLNQIYNSKDVKVIVE